MKQTIAQKEAEVRFRRKLFRQQVHGEAVVEDEFGPAEIEDVLRQRMVKTHNDMSALQERGVLLSPYLEVGAERCQRALVLENDFGLEGAALDISYDLLRSGAYYGERFGYDRLPLRICGDAYRIPLRTGSVPFVFCYQTLHHFPDPGPVLEEIHRVLAPGGSLFFAEEPFPPRLHWEIFTRKGGAYQARGRGRLSKVLHRLFVREIVNEELDGVLENHGVQIEEWRDACAIFESGEVWIELDRFKARLGDRKDLLHEAMLRLLGGLISGLYRKKGRLEGYASNIADALTAPPEGASGREVRLMRDGEAFVAEDGRRFPFIDGVAMLLPPQTLASLYPEFQEGGSRSER